MDKSNALISVKESGEDIVFLRKIIKGGADKSYGIQVAKLAGVPEVVLARAREIADELAEVANKVFAPSKSFELMYSTTAQAMESPS